MNLQTPILTGLTGQNLWETTDGHIELLRLPSFLTQGAFRPTPLLHLLASKGPSFRLDSTLHPHPS